MLVAVLTDRGRPPPDFLSVVPKLSILLSRRLTLLDDHRLFGNFYKALGAPLLLRAQAHDQTSVIVQFRCFNYFTQVAVV